MANKLTRMGGPGKFGAWVRYGGKPITQQQLDFAVKNYSVAILYPWELDAVRYLKKRAPQMVVLAYKCLSSTRSYEPGPIYSLDVSYPLAQSMANSGKDFFAHRLNGDRIEWKGYPKYFQLQVWNADYRWHWVDAVVREMRNSPFDGVMADNDVENDYYGLNLPIQGVPYYHSEDRSYPCLYSRLGCPEYQLEGCGREGPVRSGGCGKRPGALELHAAGASGCGVPP